MALIVLSPEGNNNNNKTLIKQSHFNFLSSGNILALIGPVAKWIILFIYLFFSKALQCRALMLLTTIDTRA